MGRGSPSLDHGRTRRRADQSSSPWRRPCPRTAGHRSPSWRSTAVRRSPRSSLPRQLAGRRSRSSTDVCAAPGPAAAATWRDGLGTEPPCRPPSGSASPSSPSSRRRSTSTASRRRAGRAPRPPPTAWPASTSPCGRCRRTGPRASSVRRRRAAVPWLYTMWSRPPGGLVRPVGGDRPPCQPPRRDGVRPQPPGPLPVLTRPTGAQSVRRLIGRPR